jgi:hypothetical protein
MNRGEEASFREGDAAHEPSETALILHVERVFELGGIATGWSLGTAAKFVDKSFRAKESVCQHPKISGENRSTSSKARR